MQADMVGDFLLRVSVLSLSNAKIKRPDPTLPMEGICLFNLITIESRSKKVLS